MNPERDFAAFVETRLRDFPPLRQEALHEVLQQAATTPQRQRGGRSIPSPAVRLLPAFGATKFAVAGVIVALFGGFLASGVLTQQAPSLPGAATDDAGTFSPTGSLAQPRVGHTATVLHDGRVLVVGGSLGDESATSTAEAWDPDTDTFSPTGSLADGRAYHSATLLPDGRVLVVGGEADSFVASAEVWDPTTSAFSPTGSLVTRRVGPIATLLPDGRVLVVGGGDGSGHLMPGEVWDPATGTFSPAGRQGWFGGLPSLTALRDGRVLIVHSRLRSAEVWDPGTDTYSPTGSPTMDWISDGTLLPDGRVLVLGRHEPTAADVWDAAEVWDPDTDTFSPAGEMAVTRGYPSVTALPDGRVLVVRGQGDDADDGEILDSADVLGSAEVWDPTTASFSPAGEMAVTRGYPSVTALPDGRVLVVGGWADYGDILASAEVWQPGDR